MNSLFYMLIHFFSKFCILLLLLLNSCALLLITEPDKESFHKADASRCIDCRSSAKSSRSRLAASQDPNQNPNQNLSNKLSLYRKQLLSSSDAVRTNAATQIGMMGKVAYPAVHDLERAVLQDNSKWVRRASVKALYKIGSRSSLAVLRKATSDSDYYVKTSASKFVRQWDQANGNLYQ
jgi:HEAT repeat protein